MDVAGILAGVAALIAALAGLRGISVGKSGKATIEGVGEQVAKLHDCLDRARGDIARISDDAYETRAEVREVKADVRQIKSQLRRTGQIGPI